jgi:RNA-directed DNA polymerase
LQDDLKNFIQGETQMMASIEVSAPPDNAQWQSIDWRIIGQKVSKL